MPQIRKKVDIIVCMLAVQLALYFIVPSVTGRINTFIDTEGVVRDVVDAAFYVIRFTVPLCVFYILRALIVKEPLPRSDVRLPAKYGVLLFFAGFMLIFMLGNVYFALFPAAGCAKYYNAEAGIWENVLNLLLFVLVPVFIEEIMFRRMILPELTVFGYYPAVLFSAMLFGLMYYDIEMFPYAFVVGVTVGAVYLKNRSVWHTVLIRAVSESLLFFMHAARISLPEKTYIITVIAVFAVAIAFGLFSIIKLISDKGLDLFLENQTPQVAAAATGFFTWPMTIYLAAAAATAWVRAFI